MSAQDKTGLPVVSALLSSVFLLDFSSYHFIQRPVRRPEPFIKMLEEVADETISKYRTKKTKYHTECKPPPARQMTLLGERHTPIIATREGG